MDINATLVVSDRLSSMGTPGSPTELKLLADPTRARIMSLIMHSPDGRQVVGRLAVELNLSQPTVSHHVKALLDEGLLEREPLGRNVWYSIPPGQLDRVADVLDHLERGRKAGHHDGRRSAVVGREVA